MLFGPQKDVRWESFSPRKTPRYDKVLYHIGMMAYEKFWFDNISSAFIHRFVHDNPKIEGIRDKELSWKFWEYGWGWNKYLFYEGVLERSPRGPVHYNYKFVDSGRIDWLVDIVCGDIECPKLSVRPYRVHDEGLRPDVIRTGNITIKTGEDIVRMKCEERNVYEDVPVSKLEKLKEIMSVYNRLSRKGVKAGSLEYFVSEMLNIKKPVFKASSIAGAVPVS